MHDRAPRRVGAVAAFAAILLGLVIALLLAEGLVRIFFDEAVQPRFVIDPGYGVRANKPDVETRHYVPGDYSVRITTNSAGMRGQREYPVARVPGKRRILMLGDSFPFGYGVEDQQVVSAVLEDLLNAGDPSGGGYEVINLSVSGFGQAEELVTWENNARNYHPDVVVLFYFENDVGNNASSELYKIAADGTLTRSAREFLPGTNLQDSMLGFAPTRWLFEHSEAWNLIRNRLSSLVQKSLIRKQGLKDYSDLTPAALALTRALLLQLVTEIRSDGAEPVFFLIPEKRHMDVTSFPVPPDQLKELGVGVVDGRTFLSADNYYTRDSHWRPIGHQKAAEQLAALIRATP